ncbi:hypothetical protein C7B82_14345 [Stenomitos frigidus ULC18]|uniref:Uncharacterized protein n=1 Tax=Stenomitos frigidus ULC18 TaxID=2107698 RepID=A0A2T1E5K8_9CYAN|nr:hypothetical protein C7B82_14345 [Stenomitos frigidus ULC18]
MSNVSVVHEKGLAPLEEYWLSNQSFHQIQKLRTRHAGIHELFIKAIRCKAAVLRYLNHRMDQNGMDGWNPGQ